MESEAKRRVVTLFCAAGIASAVATSAILKFLSESNPIDSVGAVFLFQLIPAIPFALFMLITGILVAKRGLLTLPYRAELGDLVVGPCVIVFGYYGATEVFVGIVSLIMLAPFPALWFPLGFFASGIVATVFTYGAVGVVTGSVHDSFTVTPHGFWVKAVGFGAGIALVGMTTIGIGGERFDIPHLKVLLVGEPILATLIGDWLTATPKRPDEQLS